MNDYPMQVIETPKANPEILLKIISEAYQAKVVVPEFQRSFVWGREDIEDLLTSILQGYFVGTFLILETPANNPMFPFRTIEGIENINNDARPNQHQTVRLVLDGQQRITSMVYALYSPDIPLRGSKYPYKFYFQLDKALEGNIEGAVKGISTRDSRRMAEMQEKVKTQQALPFTTLRDSSVFYRWLYSEQKVWGEEEKRLIEKFYERLQNFMIPVVLLSPESGTDNIVNIFERINRTGISLSLFDLVVARLYPKGVQLRDLWDDFKNKHTNLLEVVEPEFLLKVIAILQELEPRKSNLLKMVDTLKVDTFKNRWEEAEVAIEEAYRRIEKRYGALDKVRIPYTTMIVPLAVLLHKIKQIKAGEEAYRKVDRWYWASVFTQRYDSAVDSTSYQDVRDVFNWITKDIMPDWLHNVNAENVDLNVEEPRSAVYRGIMCLITLRGARDFLTGQPADLNVCQDDHIFSQNIYLKDYPVDIVLNRTLISKETNNRKRDKTPSQFLEECLFGHNQDETRLLNTLGSHFITVDGYQTLKQNDFKGFIEHRRIALQKAIQAALAGGAICGESG
ncbi:MAG: DUF262 domain-containing protein [Firmicutes bacterium]|nr:DUF262 domain-containing protein [Bacillota bacterium]